MSVTPVTDTVTVSTNGLAFHDSIYKVSRQIKRRENTLHNALRSIYDDSTFVQEIASYWPTLPLVANLRCGLWYSRSFSATCYFKSTDGHTGNWAFSCTRINMHVATLAGTGICTDGYLYGFPCQQSSSGGFAVRESGSISGLCFLSEERVFA